MWCNLRSAGIVTAVLVCGLVQIAAAQSLAGQHITVVGAIKQVDAGGHEVTFAGDDKNQYTLDIARAKVTLPPDVRGGLVPGMRAYVSGEGREDGTIAVSLFRVQSVPAPPVPIHPTEIKSAEPLDVTVRGTVDSVDLEEGAFVLRISRHTRTVFVTADTDLSGLGPIPADRFPVRPGQRVTVGGALQPNGTVLAGVLTHKEDIDYITAANQPNRVLVGAVLSVAGKLRGRDVNIRSADGTETKIQVPRDIPIRRLGRPISVHDLNSRDRVRVTGRMVGAEFRAARIDVLAPLPGSVPSADTDDAPTRPGL